MVPSIPLYLAKMSAKVLLTLRGSETNRTQFYSWVWASGKHGGPRLFHPSPGSIHILFLRNESGYLRTVGDYPSYDLEIRSRWLAAFLAEWRAGSDQNLELFERVVAVRLKAELQSIHNEASESWLYAGELSDLTSRSFVAGQLESLCQRLTNPVGRTQACAAYAEEFSKD
jgi:hypothetical protein